MTDEIEYDELAEWDNEDEWYDDDEDHWAYQWREKYCRRCNDPFQDGEWIIDGLCVHCAYPEWWDEQL